MNKYEELSVEVIEFNAEDIVTASGCPPFYDPSCEDTTLVIPQNP